MADIVCMRENIEWQNIWWERANSGNVKRIALLGDSVTRGYRSKLSERLEKLNGYVVDLCASSSQITDPLLWKEYQFFFDCNEWKYNQIFLQAGGQHGHMRRCCDDEEYLAIFKNNYIRLVEKISLYCPNIFIVSSTPCVQKENLMDWDVDRNRELEKRNQINKETAEQLTLPYVDIWTPLMEAKFEYNDYIHMKSKGNEFIAEYLTNIFIGR